MSNIDTDLTNKALISEHLNYLPNANSPESDEDNNPDEADKADESINTLRTSKLVFPWSPRAKDLRIHKMISSHWFKLIQGFFASTLY